MFLRVLLGGWLAGAIILAATPVRAQDGPLVPDDPLVEDPASATPAGIPDDPGVPADADDTGTAGPTAADPLIGDDPGPSDTPDKKEAPNYEAKLRQMEERIVSLKEKIYNAKTRLVLLKERILSNVVAEAYVIIMHENDMGSSFTLDSIRYELDGNKKKLFMQNKDGILDSERSIEVYAGSINPGNHTLTVEMQYSGTGDVFSYLDGYQFKITSKYSFYATQGRIVKIESVGYERGDFTYSLEDRPAVKFKVTQYQFNQENLAKLRGEGKAKEE